MTDRALRKGGLSLPMLVSLCMMLFFVVDCRLSFAGDKRPERGTVVIGAQGKPNVETAPGFQSFKTAFADAAEKIIPCVVSVIPTKIDTIVYTNNPFYQYFGDDDGMGGNPFDFFFGPQQQQPRQRGHQQQPQQRKQIIPQKGLGSGVIVSKDGYILTNFHVVNGADEIKVKTSDGREFEAKVVGNDSMSDVAVIKISSPVNDLPAAYIGDSDKLRVGDWVMAAGNPMREDLSSTVTAGIVSGLGRRLKDLGTFQNFIQTDAAINPGNSGGALINLDGELVGINTMIITPSGGFVGIGLAIPINMARKVMEDIIYEGKVSRGWLGVSIQDIDEATRDVMKLPDRKGVLIGEVFKDQPADKAGIKTGDVILTIDGKKVDDANQLRNIVAAIPSGKKVPVVLMRKGKQMTVEVKIAERDEGLANKQAAAADKGNAQTDEKVAERLGMKVAGITPELREKLGIPGDITGVAVVDIQQSSDAAIEGVRPNDVIKEINQQTVTSVDDFNRIIKSIKKGDSILLLVQRKANTFFVGFKVKN